MSEALRMADVMYPLASQGVFRTVQGEGALLGLPMVFIRLGGCPVACPSCDTDYAVASRHPAATIADMASGHYYGGTEWIWVTGGEPSVFDLLPLFAELRRRLPACRIAVATAGIRAVPQGSAHGGCDFLSVSPHSTADWVQRTGSQINLVPGLNGFALADWIPHLPELATNFGTRWVTPMHGDADSLRACMEWVNCRPGFRLGAQAHKDSWGNIP